jgi:hydrogenase-4 membrane subunit HyfE
MRETNMGAEIAGWVVVTAVLLLFPLWRIHKRAGLHPALSLLVLIPPFGILLSGLVLAISRWPAIDGAAADKGQ